jgi:hypothetical protein
MQAAVLVKVLRDATLPPPYSCTMHGTHKQL